ncbi:MarR family transcriptional regulator [Stenotrophomonas sp. CD2]|nr:MarR family transcriptional regulator [Stenotrophomonas sp. CD2]
MAAPGRQPARQLRHLHRLHHAPADDRPLRRWHPPVALAQQLGMEGPSLVRLLDKLCASDLVRRESDASDRRANLLWLTDAGHALVSELEDQLIGLRQDVFGELSMDELHAVLKAWRLLAEAADRIT